MPDQRLWDLRRRKRLTLKEVSKRSGINSERVRAIETDRRYAKPSTQKERLGLCKAFGMSMEELFPRG